MLVTPTCDSTTTLTCRIGVSWVESETLGDQAVVALNQFGNNDINSEQRPWKQKMTGSEQ